MSRFVKVQIGVDFVVSLVTQVVGGSSLSANKLMGKRSLVLAATLVLVLSLGLPVIAHGGIVAPAANAPAQASHPGSGAAAAVSKAAVVTPKSSLTPHPGYLVIHEIAPDGATTLDPAAAYDTLSFEPIINAYETLVSYNGSTTASYVPVLSTCVPSTIGCTLDYGSSLVANGSGPLAGEPEFWTFPIDPNAQFYDPGTGHHWGVTPVDVMFSLARTLSYSDLPFVASQNGWIAAQTLLPFGNSSYDFNATAGQGVHFPFNNTPFNVLSSMLVNNSTYCPPAALAAAGCITFDAKGAGIDWPFFLQIVADGLGASVTPCGVFDHNGAGLPGFTPVNGLAPNGDTPCLVGGANSTDSPTFQSFLANPSTGSNDTYWDAAQLAALNAPAIEAYPQLNIVGSGPYSAAVSLASGYTLTANPDYAQPIGCTNAMAYNYNINNSYCNPAPGGFVHQVNVTYDPDDSNSIAGYNAGTIDAGAIFASHTASNLLPLVRAGKVQFQVGPTLSNFFFGYNNIWNPSVFASDFPSQTAPNIATDFFNNVSARQFFTESYPFLNVQNQILSVGGIPYGTDTVCGPIPFGMGDYYPSNLTCPGGNPDTNPADVGGAAWWWNQATNSTLHGIYFDPEMAACKVHQCILPIVGETGAQQLNAALQQWINEIYTLSGHAIKPYEFDISFHNLIVEILFTSPGQNPVPIWNLGWAPDYPDPTDYMAPYAIPEGSYTFPDAIALGYGATNTSANRTLCGHDSGSLSDVYYWAYSGSTHQIRTECEGIAYDMSQIVINKAAPMQDSPTRVLYYNAAEQILTKLSLYVWFEQQNGVAEVAPWISLATVNSNPTIGGGADQPFFHWGYNPPNTITFKELKLPIGAQWSVTLGSQVNNTTYAVGAASAGTVVFHVPNGTQSYTINAPAGFGVAKITGPNNPNLTSGFISGGHSLLWTVVFGPVQTVSFYQNSSLAGGKFVMYTGAPWTVYVNGSLSHGAAAGAIASGTGHTLSMTLVGGASYKFSITHPDIYKAAPSHGGFGVPVSHGIAKLVKFILLTVVVKFHETGLLSGTTWYVNITAVTGPTNASFWFITGCPITGCNFQTTTANIVLKLPAGTYNFTVQSAGKTASTPTPSGIVVPPPPHTALVQPTVVFT